MIVSQQVIDILREAEQHSIRLKAEAANRAKSRQTPAVSPASLDASQADR